MREQSVIERKEDILAELKNIDNEKLRPGERFLTVQESQLIGVNDARVCVLESTDVNDLIKRVSITPIRRRNHCYVVNVRGRDRCILTDRDYHQYSNKQNYWWEERIGHLRIDLILNKI